MNGNEETKELGRKEILIIKGLVKEMKLANENRQYEILSKTKLLLEEHFSSSKGLISVLRSFNEDESNEIAKLIEDQKSIFLEFVNDENSEISNKSDENNRAFEEVKLATTEINNSLNDQIESLKDLEDVETEGLEVLNELIPRAKKLNDEICKIFILIAIAAILMIVFAYLYHMD